MTDGPFGPQGKRVERPTHEEEIERFTRAFGFQPEETYEPEEIPPEADWGLGEKSAVQAYWDRRGGRPKPAKRELTKFEATKIAPNTSVADYLPGLLQQLQAVLENGTRLNEKILALEARVNPDPCVKSHGKNFRMIDGVCTEISPDHPGQAPAPVPPSGMQKGSDIVNKILQKGGRLFTKVIAVDGGWRILSGASDDAN